MNHIQDFKQKWIPSLQGARTHVRLVIKEYSQMDKLVFHRQLDTTLRGLVVAGFDKYYALQILTDGMNEKGVDLGEWINGRTASEIIAN